MWREEGLCSAYALRYQVYCVERGYLPTENYPASEEHDEYDLHAAHFIALYDEQVVGNLRLARAVNDHFPFQMHCPTFPGIAVNYGSGAEVSRLAIAKARIGALTERCHPGNNHYGRISAREGIILCLYKAMLQYSERAGIEYWYAAMERSLVRLLGRYGIRFDPIGEVTDYYGPVSPFCANRCRLLEGIYEVQPALHAWFTDGETPAIGKARAVIKEPIQSASESKLKNFGREPLNAVFARR